MDLGFAAVSIGAAYEAIEGMKINLGVAYVDYIKAETDDDTLALDRQLWNLAFGVDYKVL